jgi:phosphoribosylamine---glycine ligase
VKAEKDNAILLVIGSGGREHALCWKLAQSELVQKIYCAPGNGGTAVERKTENVPIAVDDFAALIEFAKANAVSFTIVGPDNPLADGIVDQFQSAGLKIFGPTKAAARLESSKAFGKQFMTKAGIPTPRYAACTAFDEAWDVVKKNTWARVIKADGLALGKGVFVCDSEAECKDALEQIFKAKAFGEAGLTAILEEKIVGEELSLLLFCDGKELVPMPASQDHKRRYEGDKGPNTGGMGVYAPVALFDVHKEEIQKNILAPLTAALRSGEIDFQGIIYAGIIVGASESSSPITLGGNSESSSPTANGGARGNSSPPVAGGASESSPTAAAGAGKSKSGKPPAVTAQVLEFNARFGDPETQALMPLLESDLYLILLACADGNLKQADVTWSNRASCCVVAASDSYPASSSKGEKITFGSMPEQISNHVQIFHAGTKLDENGLTTNGGRVLAVTSTAASLPQAREQAYAAMRLVAFKGMDYRADIAGRALEQCLST